MSPTSPRLRTLCWTLLPALLALAPLHAAGESDLPNQPDETLPGFKANGVYSTGGIESVNVYSGDVNLAIPVGPMYQLSPGSSWQLKAYYSAKHWQMENYSAGETSCTYSNALGTPLLGLGWTLDLGHLADGAYRAPDGGRHYFFSSAEGGVSRDGTDLRITSTEGGSKVWFPDGTVHVFTHPYLWPRPVSGSSVDLVDYFPATEEGRLLSYRLGLTSIVDRYGRTILTVQYAASGGDPNAFKVQSVVLSPETNPRTISFNWSQTSITCGLAGTVVWPVLASISFPAPAGGVETVTFVQNPGGQNPSPTCQPRRYRDTARLGPPCPNSAAQIDDVAVPILEEISTSGVDADPIRYRFTYRAGVWNDRLRSGLLEAITLPTGGTIRYEYHRTSGQCTMGLTPGCDDPETSAVTVHDLDDKFRPTGDRMQSYLDSSPGVMRRTEADPLVPGSPSGTWESTTEYVRKQFIKMHFPSNDVLEDRIARAVIVRSPSGNGDNFATRHVFHVSYEEEEPEQAASGGGVELVRRVYDSADPTTVPIRSTVSCFEANEGARRCGYWGLDGQPNSFTLRYDVRQQKELTWYGANPLEGGDCSQSPTPCRQVENGAYSAAAREYTTRTLTHTLPIPEPNFWPGTRIWETTFTPLADEAHWLPKRKSTESVSDPGGLAPSDVSTTFDYSSTLPAFLTSVLRSDARTDYPGSVTRTFEPDEGGHGYPVSETIGGSGAVAGSFVTRREFGPTGLLTRKTRDGIAWNLFDVVRDQNLGLVTESRDPNQPLGSPALKSTFAYDAFSRLVSVQAPGEWPQRICYAAAQDTPQQAAFVVVRRAAAPQTYPTCKATDDGVPQSGFGSLEAYQYDGFGRLVREVRRFPNAFSSTGSYLALRYTRYDAAGHDSFVSEWAPCATSAGATDLRSCFVTEPTQGTTRSSFDPFGRPRVVVAADGATTSISYQDGGISHSDTLETVTVANVGPGANATTATRRDALGRIVEVTEPSVDGSTAKTVYGYIVTDKLAGVLQPDGAGQIRQFDWDRHGFLRNERHPEIRDPRGPSSDPDFRALIAYPSYDPFGMPLSKLVVWPSHQSPPLPLQNYREFGYAYDAASRLLAVDVGGNRYLENRYDGSGYSGQNPAGHLTQRVGYSFDRWGSPAASVTESFSYGSASGRLSYKTTAMSSPAVVTEERWEYGSWGQLVKRSHPQLPATVLRLAETRSFRSGLPTAMTASENEGAPQTVLSGVTYDPSGGIASYTTGNGAVTTVSPDPSGRPRPKRIQTTLGPAGVFDTGDYEYDGHGNVTRIGQDAFTYDSRSRLVTASVRSPSGGTVHAEEFRYDRFGNIDYWRRDGDTQSPSPDPATNRLESGFGIDYDPMGNLVQHGYGTQYFYDLLSRQVEYRDTSLAYDEQYLYDAEGERVARIGGVSGSLTLYEPGIVTAPLGASISFAFEADGGTRPYAWSTSGPLPAGLSLNPVTGVLSGTPSASGLYVFTVAVTDAFQTVQRKATLVVEGSYLFFPTAPCRLVDTRPGAPAVYSGPPAIPNWGAKRDFVARGLCGVPGNAHALAANVTSVFGPSNGFVKAFATGLDPAPTINTVPVRPGYVWAARTDIQLDATNGSFSLGATMPSGDSVDAIVDVFGYFARPGGQLRNANALRPLTGARWSRAMPEMPGGSAYVTLRNDAKQIATELLQVNQQGPFRVMKDYFYLGNLQVATLERLQSFSGWKYYASDHLGTPRLEMAPSGQTLFKYWPYGEKLPESGPTQRVGFAAMELDTGSANHYDHARFYRGVVGRFTAVDSANGQVEDPASWNRYTYARDNPLKYVDRDGRANDWAYGPFSDGISRNTYIQWNSVTPQQKAVEYGLAGLTALAAFGPLAALGAMNYPQLFIGATVMANTPGGQQAIAAVAEVTTGTPLPGAVPTLGSLSSVLKPGGVKIGEEMANTTIRGLVGSKGEAATMFTQLTGSAEVKKVGGVLVAEVQGVGKITLREASSTPGTVATIEIRGVQGLGVREVKFFRTVDDLNGAKP